MTKHLTFTEEGHVYRVNGKPVPSVTEILQGVGLVDTRWFKEVHAIRGQYVHKATALQDTDELDFDSVDVRLLPYVRAYQRFLTEARYEPVLIEKAFYSDTWGYAGTPDRLALLSGRKCVIDIKTGSVPVWVKWQTAAYLELVRREFPAAERYSLQLKEDGTYRLSDPLTDPNDWHQFCAFLTTFRCLKATGRIEKHHDN